MYMPVKFQLKILSIWEKTFRIHFFGLTLDNGT